MSNQARFFSSAALLTAAVITASPCTPAEVTTPFTAVFSGHAEHWGGGWAVVKSRVVSPGNISHYLTTGVILGNGNFAVPLPGNAQMGPYSFSQRAEYDTACPGTMVVAKDANVSYPLDFAVFRNAKLIGTVELPPFISGQSFTVLMHTSSSLAADGYCGDPPGTVDRLLDHPHYGSTTAGWVYDVNELYAADIVTEYKYLYHEYWSTNPEGPKWTYLPGPASLALSDARAAKARFMSRRGR